MKLELILQELDEKLPIQGLKNINKYPFKTAKHPTDKEDLV